MKHRTDLDIMITASQEQLLVGTLFGDASCVLQKGSSNPYIRIGQSLKDTGYTEWKHSQLLSTNLVQNPVDKYGAFNTIQHPTLWKYRTLFYSGRTKVVTRELLNLLEPFGIAVWFMDDGCLSGRISRSPGPYYIIAMSCFSFEEAQMVCSWLMEKYGIEFRAYRQKVKGYNRDYPYIATTKIRAGKQFAELVDEYIPEPMVRKKFRSEYWDRRRAKEAMNPQFREISSIRDSIKRR